MNHRLVPVLLSLALAACATEPVDSDGALPQADVFGTGSADELALAEELAHARLLADTDGPARIKGIDELRTLKVHVDDLTGMAHAKVQQLHEGVPVWGGEAIVHFSTGGKVASITDDLRASVQVDTTPLYDADEAIDLAVELDGHGWQSLTAEPTADLWVLRHLGRDHLVWRVSLHRVDSADPAIPVLFVDAHTGEQVWAYDNMQGATCSGSTNYYGTKSVECYTDGSSYYLENQADNLGTFSWGNTTTSLYYNSNSSTTWGTSSTAKNAFEAHWVSQQVYDYFLGSHGRTGIDGAGGPAYVSTHGDAYITTTTSYSRNYGNAYWDPTNEYIVLGDGDGTYMSSVTSLDILGHEFTHGVTQNEANLTYSGESGHLNESMSDVFGAMIERYALGESADTWWMGEDVWTPSVSGDALRYMDDPADDGYAWDYYSSSIAYADVHDGSGVGNLAFYLLSEGGTHPRGKSTTAVTAIGADDAADIWYLALTSYMTSSTSYAGARTATLSAAAALFGSSSTQYTQVGNAWAAVGVGGSSGGGSSACTTSTYTGSISRRGASVYAPSSSGTSVTVSSQAVSLSGPSSADFDIYLQKKSGSRWSNVASSTADGSSESISYSGSSGTYRVRVYSYSGTGSFSLSWCK
ncbi:M4 family metallopeptidase [Myxococcota bacterium]|nr:M4 family metallopeptidase [Myxococcota bacterium]